MKLKALTIGLLAILTVIPVAGKTGKRSQPSQATEKTIAADSKVSVALCVLAGNVEVQAWDRNEVMARSSEGARIEFRRDGVEGTPAARVQIVVTDQDDTLRTKRGCQASSDIELRVPRGATVQVQSREGNINISGVATAYAGSQNGDINLERVSRVIEVGTLGGSVSVNDSTGRMDLNSIGGNVVISNVRPVDLDDVLEITSVSGDLELDRAAHGQINLRTVNGNMRMSGPLTKGGRYGINTMSGDVTLALPADASFHLHAKISTHADIITDFPLTLLTEDLIGPPGMSEPPESPSSVNAPEPPKTPIAATPSKKNPPTHGPTPSPAPAVIKAKPAHKVKIKPEDKMVFPATLRRLNAVCGSGDVLISLASFSGSVHLQKK